MNRPTAVELMWQVRQAQDDCTSLAIALLKSRDLEEEDDATILARLPSKNLSSFAVERLLKGPVFERRTRRSLKRKAVDGEHQGEQRKAIKIEGNENGYG